MKKMLSLLILLSFAGLAYSQKEQKEKNQTGSDKDQPKAQNSEMKVTPGASGVKRSIGYRFSQVISNDRPADGIFRFNNDVISKVTYLIVDDNDLSGDDQSKWYSTWEDTTGAMARGQVNLVESEGKNIVVLDVSGVFADENGFWKIPVRYVSGSMPSNGSIYYYVFERIEHKKDQDIVAQAEQPEKPAEEPKSPVVEQKPAEEPKPPVVEQKPAEEPKPPVVEQKPAEEPKPPVVEQKPAEEPKPPVVDQKPAEEPKPPVVEQKPAEEPKPPVVEQKPAEEPKPPVVEQKPAEEPKPPVVEQKPAEEPKPPVVEQKPAEEPKPPVVEQKPAEEPKPPVIEQKPAEEPKPPVVEQKPAEEPKPPVVEQKPAEEQKPPVVEQKPAEEPKPPVVDQKPAEEPKPPVVGQKPVEEPRQPVAEQPKPVTKQTETEAVSRKQAARETQTAQVTETKQTVTSQQQTSTSQANTQPAQKTGTTWTSQVTQGVPPQQNAAAPPAYNSNLPTYQYRYSSGQRARGKWYAGIIEAGYGFGVGEYGIDNFRLNFINGFHIGKTFSAGLGIGVRRYYVERESYTDYQLVSGKVQIPVFLDLRKTFSTKRVTPYLALGIGNSARFDSNADSTETVKEGLLFNPSGGIWFNISSRFAVFCGVAYEMQKMEYLLLSDDSRYKKNTSSVSLNLGIAF